MYCVKLQLRKRDNGQVQITECPYTEADDARDSPSASPAINSIPPAAMAAAAAAAGVDAVSSVSTATSSSTDSDESSSTPGSSSFGSSFVSEDDDDPFAWAQKLREIPNKVRELACRTHVGFNTQLSAAIPS